MLETRTVRYRTAQTAPVTGSSRKRQTISPLDVYIFPWIIRTMDYTKVPTMGLEDSAGLGVQNIGSCVRKNRMHGLMRGGQANVCSLPTHRNTERFNLFSWLSSCGAPSHPPDPDRPASARRFRAREWGRSPARCKWRRQPPDRRR
jgi:hypothetical protein